MSERLGCGVGKAPASEFVERNPDAPTHTMAADPHVNHVPTMTGGTGLDEVRRFYKDHFVRANPPDLAIIPISRTVGRTPSSTRW